MAEVAKRTNFDIKAMLRDLFLNVKEFYSEKAMFALIKNPVYYAISMIRQLQVVIRRRRSTAAGVGRRRRTTWAHWACNCSTRPMFSVGRAALNGATTSFMLARAGLANSCSH
jgi:hypothetical protein